MFIHPPVLARYLSREVSSIRNGVCVAATRML